MEYLCRYQIIFLIFYDKGITIYTFSIQKTGLFLLWRYMWEPEILKLEWAINNITTVHTFLDFSSVFNFSFHCCFANIFISFNESGPLRKLTNIKWKQMIHFGDFFFSIKTPGKIILKWMQHYKANYQLLFLAFSVIYKSVLHYFSSLF